MVVSEKDTGGFLAPSITILPWKGWRGETALEKCHKSLSKLNFRSGQKLLETSKDLKIF